MANGLKEALSQLFLPHCLKPYRKLSRQKRSRAKQKSDIIFLSLDFFVAESAEVCSPRNGQQESAEEDTDITDARKRKENVRNDICAKKFLSLK